MVKVNEKITTAVKWIRVLVT